MHSPGKPPSAMPIIIFYTTIILTIIIAVALMNGFKAVNDINNYSDTTKMTVANEPAIDVKVEPQVEKYEKLAPIRSEYIAKRPPKPKLIDFSDNAIKYRLLAEAGINEANFSYIDYIFAKESGWNWNIWSEVDKASFGLCQRNLLVHPIDDGEEYMVDPKAQMVWCDNYAKDRYGSWYDAYNFWLENKKW